MDWPIPASIKIGLTVRVDLGEFTTWEADRIAAFFNGVAQVLAAQGGEMSEWSDDLRVRAVPPNERAAA